MQVLSMPHLQEIFCQTTRRLSQSTRPSITWRRIWDGDFPLELSCTSLSNQNTGNISRFPLAVVATPLLQEGVTMVLAVVGMVVRMSFAVVLVMVKWVTPVLNVEAPWMSRAKITSGSHSRRTTSSRYMERMITGNPTMSLTPMVCLPVISQGCCTGRNGSGQRT